MHRRTFIKNTGLATAGLWLTNLGFSADRKIKTAIVGMGWFGTDLLLPNALATGKCEIIGLCDVNQKAFQKSLDFLGKNGQAKPQLFTDYKKMYEMPGLEAVIIATPTHWHALQFIDASKKGLHVFLEKPVSYDIPESKAMLTAQQKAGNVVQVNFERVQYGMNEQVKAFIESGASGKIRQVQVNLHFQDGPVVEKKVPDYLDYNAFCGPAPLQKYLCNEKSDTPNWRALHAFGRGAMVDWGGHYYHNARKVLNLGLPDSVVCTGGTVRNFSQEDPDYLNAHFKFGNLPLQFSCSTWGYQSPNPDTNIGVFYMGEKATIFSGELGWEVYPAEGKPKINHGETGFKPWTDEFNTKMNSGITKHFNEFFEGVFVKSNKNLLAPLDDSIVTNTGLILADMSFRSNTPIVLEPKSNVIKNNTLANNMLKRAYRLPYLHPAG